jgi:hypothetical protein
VAAAKNHFDTLHAMDYMEYAYLHLVQDCAARRVVDKLNSIEKINIEHFVTAYTLVAIPARYTIKR